ncbi:MAG: TAXI family TRAP transporter solute-binding subunit [Deltaproteobacteria bacterium]|nr:TAXI family TRAP transporter solute-binding subunit [Deltaproteobacteria bacterium]
MKKKTLLVVFLVFLAALSVRAGAQEVKAPVHLRVASLDLGSAWYVYAATFAKLWREVLPKGSTIDVLPFAGGIGNALVLDKGDADLGFLFGATANWAVQGKVAYSKKIDAITGLVGGLDKYYAAMMATRRSGITSLEEVAKKKLPVRFVAQPMGSASEFSMRLILEAYGMTYDEIKSWGGAVTPTSTGVAQAQMVDGKAEIWINVVTAGHPAVSELAISTDLVFLPLSDEVIKKLTALGYEKTSLPAKSFKGQDRDVPLVGWPTILMAHKDLKPEAAYLLTKTIVENKEKLVKAHAGFKDFTPEDAWKLDKYGIPLHPGAEKYYREKGMMK